MTSSGLAQAPTLARQILVWALLALAGALALVSSWRQGQPAALPQAQAERLPCVSYAPFRRSGHSPFDATLRVPAAEIEADLRLLATLTGCIRTYGLDHGLDAVPAIARRLGLKLVLGAWIGRDAEANDAQLRRALELAREYRDVVQLLVVGNEVLLRRELSAPQLAQLLARARQASPVPVSYAEVWEFWLRHARVLQPHVDVVSAHILPYWEDDPIGVEQAVEHVVSIAERLRQAFGPTPVFVAETGWPALGRQRGAAVAGRLQQALFVRGLLAHPATQGLGFNLIEGFDQPWKRDLEGAMGGAWGLFDAQGVLRLPLSGDLAPAAGWALPLGAAALGAAFAGVIGLTGLAARVGHTGTLRRRAARPPSVLAWTGLLWAGAWLGHCTALQWQALAPWSRNGVEWGLGLAVLGVSTLCAAAALHRLGQVWCGAALPARMGIAAWRQGPRPRPAALLGLALAALWFIAAAGALALLFDGRYRPLPAASFAAPALLLLAACLLGDRLDAGAREERLLAAIGGAAALCVLVVEGPANTQALLYAGTLLALGAATLWPAGAGDAAAARHLDQAPGPPAAPPGPAA